VQHVTKRGGVKPGREEKYRQNVQVLYYYFTYGREVRAFDSRFETVT